MRMQNSCRDRVDIRGTAALASSFCFAGVTLAHIQSAVNCLMCVSLTMFARLFFCSGWCLFVIQCMWFSTSAQWNTECYNPECVMILTSQRHRVYRRFTWRKQNFLFFWFGLYKCSFRVCLCYQDGVKMHQLLFVFKKEAVLQTHRALTSLWTSLSSEGQRQAFALLWKE